MVFRSILFQGLDWQGGDNSFMAIASAARSALMTTPLTELLPLPSDRDHTGREFGTQELAYLEQVLRSGRLNGTGSTFVPRLQGAFATRMEAGHAIACASGTAAIHAALGALHLEPGDEVVTSPITDMGAILPILYEGAVPRFADVAADTGNVTAATVAAVLTPRTRAVIVTHLFGLPCDLPPLADLCARHGVVLIEDCAQAFLAEVCGRLVGRHGQLATYSLQQGKHMTCGEGGLVTVDDPKLARGVELFVNKGFAYGARSPDHEVPGLNYRMTELQAAVAVAQLEKLDSVVERRRGAAQRLLAQLAGLPGVATAPVPPGTRHAWWRFCLWIDPDVLPGGASAMGAILARHGLIVMPHYIRKPAFECEVFRSRSRFTVLREPLARAAVGLPPPDSREHPGVYQALSRMLVLPFNEHYTDAHVDLIGQAVRAAVAELS